MDSPRDHLSPSRFVLEQLAIRDVFGCMATELAPSILRDAFTPWFFEAESWSRSENEWESIERMFGMSRGMVDLIARVSCCLSSHLTPVVHAYIPRSRGGMGSQGKPGGRAASFIHLPAPSSQSNDASAACKRC